MALSGCAPRSCECGIVSDSLSVSLSGDVFTIEALAFINVFSTTRPENPDIGQHIWELDTFRFFVWDGSDWVITGGVMPGVQLERTAAFSVPDDGSSYTTVTLPTEIIDTDGFHAGSNGFITIPTGLGGDYLANWNVTFDADDGGYRASNLLLAGNTGAPSQFANDRVGGWTPVATANNGYPGSRRLRLGAGATLTLQTIQTSGGALDVTQAHLSVTMLTHIPSLT
jgi:hypothetical protein